MGIVEVKVQPMDSRNIYFIVILIKMIQSTPETTEVKQSCLSKQLNSKQS